MQKWRLLLGTLPIALGALAVKALLRFGFDFEGWVSFGDLSPVLAAGVFLIGFMLTGVMADFKESERTPSLLAGTLATLNPLLRALAAGNPQLQQAKMEDLLPPLGHALLGWFHKRVTKAQLLVHINGLNDALVQAGEKANASTVAACLNQVGILNAAIHRAEYVSRTGFVASGYALLETVAGVIVLLLVLAKFPSQRGEMVLVPFLTLLYVSMIRLIRDIDDPFEYAADGSRSGAEIDLFPLEDYVREHPLP